MEKTVFALESFKNIQDLVKFIDQKAGVVLVISGLVLTAFLQFSRDLSFSSVEKITGLGLSVFLFGFLTIACLFIILYISINKILKPRLAKNYKKDEFSIFYFEHLASMNKEDIHLNYEELKENEILRLIIDQQYEVSKILELKISALNNAFVALFLSIVFLVIFVALTRVL